MLPSVQQPHPARIADRHLRAAQPVVHGLDNTIEGRRGKRFAAKGIYRAPVSSFGSHFVKASGLRWMSLMLLAPSPELGVSGRCRS